MIVSRNYGGTRVRFRVCGFSGYFTFKTKKKKFSTPSMVPALSRARRLLRLLRLVNPFCKKNLDAINEKIFCSAILAGRVISIKVIKIEFLESQITYVESYMEL